MFTRNKTLMQQVPMYLTEALRLQKIKTDREGKWICQILDDSMCENLIRKIMEYEDMTCGLAPVYFGGKIIIDPSLTDLDSIQLYHQYRIIVYGTFETKNSSDLLVFGETRDIIPKNILEINFGLQRQFNP